MENKANILIVDDRPENLLVMESLLEHMECNIFKANSGNEALSHMLDKDFALVLMDVQMPGMDGFETAELMRGRKKTRHIPIIFVTAISKEQKCIFKGYEVGAVDYLFKPIEPIVLQSKVSVFIELYEQKQKLREQAEQLERKLKELLELKEANGRLESLSTLDGLTGIPNRRSFDQYISMNWMSAIRENKLISLLMIDIDNFKAYNDNYGHVKGDDCLISVAQCLKDSLKRPLDFAARFGGEEFAVILPNTDHKGALLVAEHLRHNIEALGIPHLHSQTAPVVTISIGAATVTPEQNDNIDPFVEKADKALYQSKQRGRNQVSAYGFDN